MKQFEYKRLINSNDINLNELGLMGWELVSAVTRDYDTIFFFKREIPKQILNPG